MSAVDRQIENLLARVRDLEAELLLQGRRDESASWVRAPRGDAVLAKTPMGGIPAATGAGPYTWGSASCTRVGTDGVVASGTVTIKNIVNRAIAGNVVVKASRVGDIYVVDVASCGS